MRIHRTQLILGLAMVISGVANAQDLTVAPQRSNSSYGIRGGIERALYTSSFYGIPNCPQCSPLITSGSGLSSFLSIYYSYRLSDQLSLSFGAGYNWVTGTMSKDESTSINLDGIATAATITHTIDATLNQIAIYPSVEYQLLPALSLSIGGELGYLTNPIFGSREQLIDPVGRGVFDNGSRTRDAYGGAIPNPERVQAGLMLGIRYSLPMNRERTLSLVPQAIGEIGITNQIAGINWKRNGVGSSLALEYRPSILPPARREPVHLPDTIHPRVMPALLASISAVGVDPSGLEQQRVPLQIEEHYQLTYVPLVPYIFFDSGSSTLPTRYDRISSSATFGFSEAKLSASDRLSLYHQVLNTIGKRMSEHPSAQIVLTACSDPYSPPGTRAELAERRGETIRNYLLSTWKVTPERITIRTRPLPAHPSPVTDSDGLAEDRRVEVTSNEPAILEPVLTSDTIRTASPPTIRFYSVVRSDTGLANWAIVATQDGRELKSFQAEGPLPRRLDWAVSNEPATMPRAPGSMNVRLHVQDRAGQVREASTSIPVEQVTLRKKEKELQSTPNGLAEIERYTLFLFDFNSSELTGNASDENARTLALIRSRIGKHSQVSVQGFGDRIGDPDRNQRLANDRARSVAKSLNIPESDVIPASGTTYPYDNQFPEGRFYSRTVEVTIRTPLQGGE